MKIIENYITGQLSGQDFIYIARSDKSIAEWFQSIIPDGADIIDIPHIPYRIDQGREIYQNAHSTHPFWRDIFTGECFNILSDKICINEYFSLTNNFFSAEGRCDAYEFLYSLAVKRRPDWKKSNRFNEEHNFYLDVCNDCFGGPEVEKYIDTIIFEIYSSQLSIQEKKRIAKTRIKEAFHVEVNGYPRWIQDAEWPMGQQSPMAFISRKKCGECVQFLFVDVDSREEKVVKQYY